MDLWRGLFRCALALLVIVPAMLYLGWTLAVEDGNFVLRNYEITFEDSTGRPSSCAGEVFEKDGTKIDEVKTDETGTIAGWHRGYTRFELDCQVYHFTIVTYTVAGVMLHRDQDSNDLAIAREATYVEPALACTTCWFPATDDNACDSCTPPSLPAPTGCPNCVPVTPVPTPTPFPPSVPTPTPVFAVPTLNEAAWLLIAGIEHARCPECSTAWPTETPPPSVECAEPVRLVGTPTIETPELQPELPDGAPEVTSEPTQYFGDVPIETPTMPASVSSCGA